MLACAVNSTLQSRCNAQNEAQIQTSLKGDSGMWHACRETSRKRKFRPFLPLIITEQTRSLDKLETDTEKDAADTTPDLNICLSRLTDSTVGVKGLQGFLTGDVILSPQRVSIHITCPGED